MFFRRKMPVKKYQLLGKTDLFPVCPRCQLTIERDYQGFCDRCGQCLEWLE
jgi:predicted amidophosphoribosyltransferase